MYIELIESVEEKLKRVIKANLDESIKENKLSDVRGACGVSSHLSKASGALHSGLGLKEEGLQVYISHYVQELFKAEVEIVDALLAVFIEKSKAAGQAKRRGR